MTTFCFVTLAQASNSEKTELPRETRVIHSKLVNIDYKIYVSSPQIADKKKKYPVIFVLDADYFFPIVQEIMQEHSSKKESGDAIIVGITYPGVSEDKHGPIFERSRTRDYTPTHVTYGGYGEEYQKASGGADTFFDFIEKELFPYIELNYPALMSDRTLVGISYGGLATSFALLTRTSDFQKYLIISPSLWWDQHLLMRLEAEKTKSKKDMPVRVFLSAGELEQGPSADMPEDVRKFSGLLHVHNFPSYQDSVWIAPNKTHHTVFKEAAKRGLAYLIQ